MIIRVYQRLRPYDLIECDLYTQRTFELFGWTALILRVICWCTGCILGVANSYLYNINKDNCSFLEATIRELQQPCLGGDDSQRCIEVDSENTFRLHYAHDNLLRCVITKDVHDCPYSKRRPKMKYR